jgi:UDP-2,4-diacetamido-2,4,6-trideoxy-beta-L-altropyranose hydrolase
MISGALLFRADASVSIGTGHVMRCLALAQAWQDAGDCAVFATAESTPAVHEKLRTEGFEALPVSARAGTDEDSRQTVSLAREHGTEWVVVDGYRFGAVFQRALKMAGLKVLFLDDNGHAGSYSADLVLNQNVHAAESMYERREPYTRLLLGTSYTLFRREFSAWVDWRREIPATARKMLVTFGGSDPGNFTAIVLQSLQQVRRAGIEAVVVIGASNPHQASLEKILSLQDGAVRLERNVSDMAKLMAWADLAISAAGTTSLEMCLLGLPAIVVTVAENQRASARELEKRNCVIHLDGAQGLGVERVAEMIEQLSHKPKTRQLLSQHGRELVDGKGAKRVISAIHEASQFA